MEQTQSSSAAGGIGVPKLTVLFPGGDQLSSVVLEKEKNTVILDLLTRLCTVRGLEVNQLEAFDDHGRQLNQDGLQKTVEESGLMFIELLEKGHKKKEKKKKNKDEVTHKMKQGKPANVILQPGEICSLPLREQLWDDEWNNLQEFKSKHEIAKSYSDAFVMACLWARKMDFKRTNDLLENNLKWRKANGFLRIPRFQEIESILQQITMNFMIPGTRTLNGQGMLYMDIPENLVIGKEPFTVPTLKKWYAWYYMVGIFNEGLDCLRNGVVFIEDLANYSWKHFDIDFQRQMSAVWVDTFPVRIERFIVLNSPSFMPAILKILKTIIKDKMLDRVELISKAKDATKWVDENQLSHIYGGKLTFGHAQWVEKLAQFAEKHEAEYLVDIQ